MSETETRDWQSEAGRLEHLLRLSEDDRRAMRDEAEDERDRHARELARLRTEADTLRRTVARYKGDRDDAWARCAAEECDCVESVQAELSRLRAVVEAVQALADEWGADWTGHDVAAPFVRALRAVLAPVSSWANAYADPDQAHDSEHGIPDCSPLLNRCRLCGHLTVNEPPRSCAVCEAVTPAPVPSGGQADGEGEPVIPIAYQLGALADWCDSQRTSPTTADLRALAAMAASTAARPVLSRGALRKRLAATLRQNGHVEWTDLDVRNMTEHVLDVLAGGEQA